MSSTIADAIDVAINEHLWDGTQPFRLSEPYLSIVSWGAVLEACSVHGYDLMTASIFLESLGCNLGLNSCTELDEFKHGRKRQQARALWLTWAAMIAREEGL